VGSNTTTKNEIKVCDERGEKINRILSELSPLIARGVKREILEPLIRQLDKEDIASRLGLVLAAEVNMFLASNVRRSSLSKNFREGLRIKWRKVGEDVERKLKSQGLALQEVGDRD
jgi:hypothetical protein